MSDSRIVSQCRLLIADSQTGRGDRSVIFLKT